MSHYSVFNGWFLDSSYEQEFHQLQDNVTSPRAVLLAGIAIVHSGGAEMLYMLRQSTLGLHRQRFYREAMPFFVSASRIGHSTQMQLI
jgi:hypothetical protein